MANKANNDEVVTWRNGKKLNEENRLDHLLYKKESLENKKTKIETSVKNMLKEDEEFGIKNLLRKIYKRKPIN